MTSPAGRPGVLVLDGDPPDDHELAAIPPGAFVVAADGGANCLIRRGRWPDVVVGDLEGLDAAALAALEAHDVPVERHPETKDDIDGLLALERLLAAGPSSVLVLGALGGRTAMTLANLETLRRCLDAGVPARIVAHGEEIVLLGPGHRHRVTGAAGRVFNVLADTRALTFSVHGARYAVDRIAVARGSSRGISNELDAGAAEVEVHEGRAFVVVEAEGG